MRPAAHPRRYAAAVAATVVALTAPTAAPAFASFPPDATDEQLGAPADADPSHVHEHDAHGHAHDAGHDHEGDVLADPAPAGERRVEAAGSIPYDAVIDITFPTAPSARYGNDYDACRSGCSRYHRATDLMDRKLTPLYAARAGTICYINGINEPMPSWGYSLTLCGDDGRSYRYVHVNNDRPGTDDGHGGVTWAYAPGIERGKRVARGQFLAYMGDSGNAEGTPPHLHFEIHDDRVTDPYGSSRMNPYPSLQSARARGDYADGSAAYTDPMRRVAGAYRVATAAALSKDVFDRAGTVVLAPAGTPSEAIVSGPLAAALGGPVLTTGEQRLDPVAAAEIARLGADEVVLVGGLDRITAGSLRDAGVTSVRRIRGANVFETAGLVADEVWARTGSTEALVALGRHAVAGRDWPDALMASWYGSLTGTPVLLVEDDTLPLATARRVKRASAVIVLGGTAAIEGRVEDAIRLRADNVERLYGLDRFGTAAAVGDRAVREGAATRDVLWAATGANWPDAATAGPAVAAAGGLLALIDGAEGRRTGATDWIASQAGAVDEVVAIGGTAAVSAAALRATGVLAA